MPTCSVSADMLHNLFTMNKIRPNWTLTCVYSPEALEEGAYHKVSCFLSFPVC